MTEYQMQYTKDVEYVLRNISFAPSCVDMGWEWQIECLDSGMGTAGFLIRTTFQRPDRVTGEIQSGFGRWWHVPYEATESAVVKTAYAACRLILEHELMESFKYKNDRIFDPHHSVESLRHVFEV